MVMIGIAQTDPYKGCFITFQLPFSVYLRGKVIQVKMSLYKMMVEFFNQSLRSFSILFPIKFSFLKMTQTEKNRILNFDHFRPTSAPFI